jgi:hypothetical protein
MYITAASCSVGFCSASILEDYKEYKMDFTLAEAKSLVGRAVTVRPERREEVDFDGLFRFSEQGTIIGISGQDTPQGIPEIAVVIQFWVLTR